MYSVSGLVMLPCAVMSRWSFCALMAALLVISTPSCPHDGTNSADVRYLNNTINVSGSLFNGSGRGYTCIAGGTFVRVSLRTVDLSNNSLTVLQPGIFVQMPKLHTLILSFNSLSTLRDFSFQNLRLETLNISYNQLHAIQEDTFRTAHVRSLDLQHNFLETLSDQILGPLAGSLQRLSLRHNLLQRISPDTFSSLSLLVSLDISDNRIVDLTPDLFRRTNKLTDLDLSGNQIREVSVDFLGVIKSGFKQFLLHSNPLSCNCVNKWLQGYRELLPNENCSASHPCSKRLYCFRPGSAERIAINDFPNENFTCTGPRIVRADVVDERLRCEATGDPLPQLEWKLPNGTVQEASNISVQGPGVNGQGRPSITGYYGLTFASHAGTYQCVAVSEVQGVRDVASRPILSVGSCALRDVCYDSGSVAGAAAGMFSACVVVAAAIILCTKQRNKNKKSARQQRGIVRFKNNVYRDVTTATCEVKPF